MEITNFYNYGTMNQVEPGATQINNFYGYANNMSRFEREFHCTEGLLSNTFRNNPYMQMPVEKWQGLGAKERVLRLVEAFRKAVEQGPAEATPTE